MTRYICNLNRLLPHSQAIAWLGDTSKFGVSRVMDVCRASTTGLSADAGNTKGCVSFQVRKLFKPVRHGDPMTAPSSPNTQKKSLSSNAPNFKRKKQI